MCRYELLSAEDMDRANEGGELLFVGNEKGLFGRSAKVCQVTSTTQRTEIMRMGLNLSLLSINSSDCSEKIRRSQRLAALHSHGQ